MKLRLLTLLSVLLYSVWIWAAENQVEPTEEPVETEATNEVVAQDSEATAEEIAAADADEAALEDEESPGRFIPTEQISQDLGVSFPIDI